MLTTLLCAVAAALPNQAQLQRMTARFAPTELTVDLSRMPDGERAALARLVQAARLFDAVFLRQTWGGNPDLALRVFVSPGGCSGLSYGMSFEEAVTRVLAAKPSPKKPKK